MLPISVCIIAKNEEKFIQGCLEHLKPYGFEIVLVDTGSTDRTKEIAAQFTDKIYDFEWIKDFSAARNFAASKATNDWIISIDCDEYLEKYDTKELLLHMKSFPDSSGSIILHDMEKDDIHYSSYNLYRIYNRKYFHFENAIHEQLLRIDKKPATSFETSFTVKHYGYSLDEAALQKKNERNIELLLQISKENPDNPYYYFQLGKSYSVLGNDELSLSYFEKATSLEVEPKVPYVQELIYCYGHKLLEMKQYETALGLAGIYEEMKFCPEYIYLMGLIYMYNDEYVKAIAEFTKVQTMKSPTEFLNGVTTYQPLYQLGLIFEFLGKKDIAITYYKKAGDFSPAQNRLKLLESSDV